MLNLYTFGCGNSNRIITQEDTQIDNLTNKYVSVKELHDWVNSNIIKLELCSVVNSCSKDGCEVYGLLLELLDELKQDI